jgi:hypothetical protein
MSHPHYSEFHGLEIKIRYSKNFIIKIRCREGEL